MTFENTNLFNILYFVFVETIGYYIEIFKP